MLAKVATREHDVENGWLVTCIARTNGEGKLLGWQPKLIYQHAAYGAKGTIETHCAKMLCKRMAVYLFAMTMQQHHQVAELAQPHTQFHQMVVKVKEGIQHVERRRKRGNRHALDGDLLDRGIGQQPFPIGLYALAVELYHAEVHL